MQIAEILSDLTTLRAADHAAASALVSARPSVAGQPTSTPAATSSSVPSDSTTTLENAGVTTEKKTGGEEELDPELQRGKDLIRLHYEVKVAHSRGELERQLDEARGMVGKALVGLRS